MVPERVIPSLHKMFPRRCADKALGFLGIHTTTNAFGFTLPAALNAATAEAGKGVNGGDKMCQMGAAIIALPTRVAS